MTRRPSVGYVFHDFEFRDHPTTGSIVLVVGCFWHMPSGQRVVIDFRTPDAVDHLAALQRRWADCIWFSYSARAEMTAFLTCGLPVDDMQWIDLMVESRQITGTHYHFEAQRAGLLVTLQALGIATVGTAEHKEAMRQLILTNETYTDEQFAQITEYCWMDIEPLPELWAAILKIHGQRKFAHQPIAPFQTAQSVFRADALKAFAKLEHRSRGFPIDVAWLERIYANHRAIRKAIAEKCNAEYQGKVFRYVKNKDQYSMHLEGLDNYVASLPFPVNWERTKTGKLRRDANYLEQFTRENPHFLPLRNTLVLLDQLKSGDLRRFLKDGFIAGSSIPFYTVTSRSQPLASQGFVFSLAHWLRSVVRPHPRHVMIGADWSQQEVVIGASLSGDRMLAQALATGDVYLALAKMAGVIPEEATKKSHPIERQSFKSVQLGIQYGMGILKLGFKLFLDLQAKGVDITLDEATERAAHIHRWHKQTFTAYWQFIAREVDIAKQQGWMRAKDGWTYFCNQNSAYTKLQNYHMQTNGAVMLREAVKILADIDDVELVATLHDGIYLYCHEDDEVIHRNHLERAMAEASQRVLGNAPLPLNVRVDTHVYTHETGYVDDDGVEMLDHIRRILDDLGV